MSQAGSQPFSMSDHIYKKIELVGSSPNGIEDAVKNALTRAKKTVRNMRWFEIAETRGYLEEGNIAHWQVTLLVAFPPRASASTPAPRAVLARATQSQRCWAASTALVA